MSFSSWLRSRKSALSRSFGAKSSRRESRRAQSRPRVEQLESRLAPAVYTVNLLTDTGAGSGATGDLRYCINASNTNTGDDTILFDSTVFATAQAITLTGGALALTDTSGTTTIDGPGANLLTIDGNRASGVFTVGLGAR